MTPDPVTLKAEAPVIEAARKTKERDIGAVIVLDGDQVCGVVTDRDLVVRVIADGRDSSGVRLQDVCSRELASVSPDDDLTRAGKLMRGSGRFDGFRWWRMAGRWESFHG